MKLIRKDTQHYNAWLHWDITKRCNLDCEYCFGKITDTSIKVNKIHINKLLTTLEATGKIFRISFTGGEPTLVPNFVEACKSITEKHYISFNSNLISKNIKKFAKAIAPDRVIHIHASFHYDELSNNGLLNRFVEQYKLLETNGFNIYTEAVAYPKFLKNIDTIKTFVKNEKLNLSFAPFYGKFDDKIYPEDYSPKELELFGITQEEIGYFFQKGKLCNAGYNAAVVFSNGNVYPCHGVKTKMGNIYTHINFAEHPLECPSKKCGCPLNKYDNYLFQQISTDYHPNFQV